MIMSETAVRIETIYSADDSGPGHSTRLQLWGWICLAVAAAWLYVVWWPVYDWAQAPLMMGTINAAMTAPTAARPATGQDSLDQLNQLLNPQTDRAKNNKQGAEPSGSESRKSAKKNRVKKSGKTRQSRSAGRTTSGAKAAGAVMGLGLVAWIIVPTLMGLWIAMAGAASLSADPSFRSAGKILAPVVVLALGAVTWHIWRTTQWYESILPEWTKPVMLGLAAAAAASLGMALNRKSLFLQRFGAVLAILSAGLTVGAFWAAIRWGQMPAEGVGVKLYARVFAQQSAWGWVTLLVLRGLK